MEMNEILDKLVTARQAQLDKKVPAKEAVKPKAEKKPAEPGEEPKITNIKVVIKGSKNDKQRSNSAPGKQKLINPALGGILHKTKQDD